MSIIIFLHPCHVPVIDSDRIEFIAKDEERPEESIPKDWLQGALEHQFCARKESTPEPAADPSESDAPAPDGTETEAPVPTAERKRKPPKA